MSAFKTEPPVNIFFASRSFPNKQKSSESSGVAMNSTLGSNLSELDRLLLELNAVQHSTPAFPTEGTHTLTHSHTERLFLCPDPDVTNLLSGVAIFVASYFLVTFNQGWENFVTGRSQWVVSSTEGAEEEQMVWCTTS